MKAQLFSAFLPWIFFSVVYGTTSDAMLFGSLGALSLTLIFNFKELKQGFVLPWAAFIFFLFLTLNSYWTWSVWAESHALLLVNAALALSIWISMLIGKPFTLQYARREVDAHAWITPLFRKINWILTSIWAVLMSIIALPAIFIPEPQLLDSWFWNYGLSVFAVLLGLACSKRIPNWYIGRNFWEQVKQQAPLKTPYLQNAYAPVKDEVELNDLKIEGHLPLSLNGTYLRNGPNPFSPPYTYTYPIDGDGMIHAVQMAHGWAGYKNHFVKTKGFLAEQKAGKTLYGGVKLPLVPDPKYVKDGPIKNAASVHIAMFGKHLLALYEASPAYELDQELNTLGEWQPQKATQVPFNINAHHRRDPKNGHIYAFTYDTLPPYLTFYEFDQSGALVTTIPIEKAYPTMLHDFVLTENYLIVFDVPAIFNMKGPEVLTFDQEQPVNILLIDRHHYEVKKVSTASFFVYHFVNAYEQDEQIVVDFIHHETLNFDPLLQASKKAVRGPRLYRGIINLAELSYQHECLSELTVEFPSYALQHTGRFYRYAYLCAKSSETVPAFDVILKYDFEKRTQQLFKFAQWVEVDEAIFVAEEGADKEDQGCLMLFVYQPESDTSDFVILNAAKPRAKPVAVVKLERRVPHGLHGSWVAKARA